MAATREIVQLMTASEIDRTLVRLAHEILERVPDLQRLALIGIHRRGVPLARRLAEKIRAIEGHELDVGSVDVTRYRDDLSVRVAQPVVHQADIPFDVTGRHIMLVDDVLFTGRTARAAMNAVFDRGRPARVDLLVLIDRGHRELPIEAGYVGRKVPTRRDEQVQVRLMEIDGEERVTLELFRELPSR